MFIKNLTIKNYRCFSHEPINDFNFPDGSEGSGLNLFIGENGNGKTSVLEAIKLLTQSRLKTKNTFSVKDFYDIEKKIEISCECSSEFEVKRTVPRGSFKANGFYFYANLRKMDDKNLVDPLVFDNQYVQSDSTNIMEPEKRLEVQSTFGPRFSEMQMVYLDKKRTRSVSEGEHTDKFANLLSDFNFQFSRDVNNFKKSNKLNDDIRKVLIDEKSSTDKILEAILDEFKAITNIEVKLDHLSIIEPFMNSFFAIREESNIQQIPITKLGSGYEMIFTILFLKNYYSLMGKKTIYLIDEPELHLHPRLQETLVKILLDISKTDQIVISTHSPFLFKNLFKTKTSFRLFTRGKDGVISIQNARHKEWGLFDWSPSWGEINFFAYNLPTIEFHDELYGYLHEKYISDAADKDEAKERSLQENFDSYLKTKITELPTKKWIKEYGGTIGDERDFTLATFIRNKVHHPENSTMQRDNFSMEELGMSTNALVRLAKE